MGMQGQPWGQSSSQMNSFLLHNFTTEFLLQVPVDFHSSLFSFGPFYTYWYLPISSVSYLIIFLLIELQMMYLNWQLEGGVSIYLLEIDCNFKSS